MTKATLIVLGVGLVILGIVGLGSMPTTPWLMWLDLIVGLVSFFGAFALREGTPISGEVGSATAASIVLYALWVIGLAVSAVAWQAWWTFAFACAYLLAALMGGSRKAEQQQPELQIRKRA